jgi:alpha-glucosidase
VDRVGQVRRRRVYEEDRPEVHDYLREIRAALGDRVCLLGEVWLLDQEAVHGYLRPDELDLAFNFSFSTSPWNPRIMADEISTTERLSRAMGSWPCYHLSNHDQPRHGTRFGERSIRAAAVVLLTLRGTPVLYYGEEIGMVDGVVPPERRRDRAGRDGCRTPMQWDISANAGFCPEGVEPWLPLAAGWETRNAEAESSGPDSVLSLYRRLLALRGSSPALRWGTYRPLRVIDGCFAYARETEDEALAIACNFTAWPATVTVPPGSIAVSTALAREGERVAGLVELEDGQAIVVRMEAPQSGSTEPPTATSPGSDTSA